MTLNRDIKVNSASQEKDKLRRDEGFLDLVTERRSVTDQKKREASKLCDYTRAVISRSPDRQKALNIISEEKTLFMFSTDKYEKDAYFKLRDLENTMLDNKYDKMKLTMADVYAELVHNTKLEKALNNIQKKLLVAEDPPLNGQEVNTKAWKLIKEYSITIDLEADKKVLANEKALIHTIKGIPQEIINELTTVNSFHHSQLDALMSKYILHHKNNKERLNNIKNVHTNIKKIIEYKHNLTNIITPKDNYELTKALVNIHLSLSNPCIFIENKLIKEFHNSFKPSLEQLGFRSQDALATN